MNLLITGSTGFLGQFVVESALSRGHKIRAVRRSRPDRPKLSWEDYSSVEVCEADLINLKGHEWLLDGMDGVIHLVASKSGDFDTAYRGTVETTQNLLSLMAKRPVSKFVLVSSLSVYDYSQLRKGDVLDEKCKVGENFKERDAYARTKLLQESMVREFAEQHEVPTTIIRPGMLFGRGALWNAAHGASAGLLWCLIGAEYLMPLTYVGNCAEAIVLAAESENAVGKTLNIVDDDLPTRKAYTEAVIAYTAPRRVLPVNQSLLEAIASSVYGVNRILLQGKVKLPGLLTPARLEARFKPLRYPNQLAKEVLGWQPEYGWREALQLACTNAEDASLKKGLVGSQVSGE